MTNVFRILSDFVFKVEKVIVMIVITAMFVALVAGVLFRYFLNSPIFWADEFAIFCLIWMTFIGGSMSVKRQEAAAVTILVDLLKGKLRKAIISISLLIVLVFSAAIVYYAVIWLTAPSIGLQTSTSMKVPMIYPYLSVLVGFVFMTIHSIYLLLISFKKSTEKGGV